MINLNYYNDIIFVASPSAPPFGTHRFIVWSGRLSALAKTLWLASIPANPPAEPDAPKSPEKTPDEPSPPDEISPELVDPPRKGVPDPVREPPVIPTADTEIRVAPYWRQARENRKHMCRPPQDHHREPLQDLSYSQFSDV